MRWTCHCVVAGLCLLALSGHARAKIRADFTPIQLCEQSEQILVVKLKTKSDDKPVFEIVEALKGEAAKDRPVTIDLTQTQPEPRDAARKLFKDHADEAALLFAGTFDHEGKAYLSLHGTWLELADGKDGNWLLAVVANDTMNAVWNGGTDMLDRCVRYVLKNPGTAFIPVEPGAAWRDLTKLKSVPEKPTAMCAVDLAGDGKLTLFVASPNGDRLIRISDGEDITASTRLDTKSVVAAWGDLNGDGRADLVSFDGKELRVAQQNGDGTFAARSTGYDLKGATVLGVAIVSPVSWRSSGVSGTGIAFNTEDGVTLLKPTGDVFRPVQLLLIKNDRLPSRGSAGCVVADFDGDGTADILLPGNRDGTLWLDKESGLTPTLCNVATGDGSGRASITDFDGDGMPDVLITGASGVRLYQNDGHGKFEETLSLSGEAGSKASPSAVAGGSGDFNNDGRADLFVLAPDRGVRMWFNRGFRSFGEAPKLEEKFNTIDKLSESVALAVAADFRGEGAQSLILALRNGDLYEARNEAGGAGALSVNVRLKAATRGPVNASLWKDDRCLGGVTIDAGSPGFFGIADAGPYTIKWTVPGQKPASKAIVVEKRMSVVLE